MLLDLLQAQLAAHAKENSGSPPAFRFENLGLTEIPTEFVEKLATYNPAKLSFQNNNLISLPENLRKLKNLYYLDISGNRFMDLPLVVCQLEQLEILDVSSNRLCRLPQRTERLVQLQVISLKNNNLTVAPPVLADFPNLTFVELDQNPLTMPPAETEEKNDPEWLADYISRQRPAIEAQIQAPKLNFDGRKRMGVVLGDERPTRAVSTPTSPTSTDPPSLQPSPLAGGPTGMFAGPNTATFGSGAPSGPVASTPTPAIVGERLLFALRQFLRGLDGLGRHAIAAVGQSAYTQATARVAELSSAIDAGVKYVPHLVRAIEAVLEILKPIQQQCAQLCAQSDICAIRALLLQTFHAFNELNNAWNALITPQIDKSHVPAATDFAAADELLYNQLESATTSSQAVLSLLNETVARSALASTDPSSPASTSGMFATRVRDLSNACIMGFTATRRLKYVVESRNSKGIPDRRLFWEDVNSFLKSIIAILAAAKSAMADLPLLAEVRPQISTLARVAKEIPPLLEQSSYKLSMIETTSLRQVQPPLPMPNLRVQTQGPISPSIQPPTPLTASLGTAAQAVLSPGLHQQTPFFHEVGSSK